VVEHDGLVVLKERTLERRPTVRSACLARPWHRRGEEGGLFFASIVIREDAREDAREEVRKEEVVGVDGVTPGVADAPGLGERAAREAAEDVEENIVGEADAVAVVPVHRAGRRWCGNPRRKASIEGLMEGDIYVRIYLIV
jgi:hypothetical protein